MTDPTCAICGKPFGQRRQRMLSPKRWPAGSVAHWGCSAPPRRNIAVERAERRRAIAHGDVLPGRGAN